MEVGLKEPLLREVNDFMDVEFYRPNISETVVKASDTVGKVSDNEQIIIDYIQKHSQITSKNVESLLALKEARARWILKEMVEKGIIVRLGRGRSTYYVLEKL